jgi:hypothetical protein
MYCSPTGLSNFELPAEEPSIPLVPNCTPPPKKTKTSTNLQLYPYIWGKHTWTSASMKVIVLLLALACLRLASGT